MLRKWKAARANASKASVSTLTRHLLYQSILSLIRHPGVIAVHGTPPWYPEVAVGGLFVNDELEM